ncbi:MAG: hypothetical protein JSW40_03680 [Candidatus Omnitrophota bacterium]|nr:MAG: hypothetical protein JSW40_03680 [Candidatus Omnitrophota bacterium]
MKKIVISLPFFLILCVGFAADEERVYFDLQTIRDPLLAPEGFRELGSDSQVYLEKVLSGVEIMGVVTDGDKKYVIINNNIIKEKGTWQGLVVDSIEKDYIVVIYRGRKTKIPYKRGHYK